MLQESNDPHDVEAEYKRNTIFGQYAGAGFRKFEYIIHLLLSGFTGYKLGGAIAAGKGSAKWAAAAGLNLLAQQLLLRFMIVENLRGQRKRYVILN
jgi:hypothetical protein